MLQELLGADKDNITADSLQTTDGSSGLFRVTFNHKSILVKLV
jgi:hypothetical protein